MDRKPKERDAAHMGLNVKVTLGIMLGGVLMVAPGCVLTKSVNPADRVKNEVFKFDCCDPGISSGTKEMCDLARDSKNSTLVDGDGNRYKFYWSDCTKGAEPWRKWN